MFRFRRVDERNGWGYFRGSWLLSTLAMTPPESKVVLEGVWVDGCAAASSALLNAPPSGSQAPPPSLAPVAPAPLVLAVTHRMGRIAVILDAVGSSNLTNTSAVAKAAILGVLGLGSAASPDAPAAAPDCNGLLLCPLRSRIAAVCGMNDILGVGSRILMIVTASGAAHVWRWAPATAAASARWTVVNSLLVPHEGPVRAAVLHSAGKVMAWTDGSSTKLAAVQVAMLPADSRSLVLGPGRGGSDARKGINLGTAVAIRQTPARALLAGAAGIWFLFDDGVWLWSASTRKYSKIVPSPAIMARPLFLEIHDMTGECLCLYSDGSIALLTEKTSKPLCRLFDWVADRGLTGWCVHQHVAILVGRTDYYVHDLLTGVPLWQEVLPSGMELIDVAAPLWKMHGRQSKVGVWSGTRVWQLQLPTVRAHAHALEAAMKAAVLRNARAFSDAQIHAAIGWFMTSWGSAWAPWSGVHRLLETITGNADAKARHLIGASAKHAAAAHVMIQAALAHRGAPQPLETGVESFTRGSQMLAQVSRLMQNPSLIAVMQGSLSPSVAPSQVSAFVRFLDEAAKVAAAMASQTSNQSPAAAPTAAYTAALSTSRQAIERFTPLNVSLYPSLRQYAWLEQLQAARILAFLAGQSFHQSVADMAFPACTLVASAAPDSSSRMRRISSMSDLMASRQRSASDVVPSNFSWTRVATLGLPVPVYHATSAAFATAIRGIEADVVDTSSAQLLLASMEECMMVNRATNVAAGQSAFDLNSPINAAIFHREPRAAAGARTQLGAVAEGEDDTDSSEEEEEEDYDDDLSVYEGSYGAGQRNGLPLAVSTERAYFEMMVRLYYCLYPEQVIPFVQLVDTQCPPSYKAPPPFHRGRDAVPHRSHALRALLSLPPLPTPISGESDQARVRVHAGLLRMAGRVVDSMRLLVQANMWDDAMSLLSAVEAEDRPISIARTGPMDRTHLSMWNSHSSERVGCYQVLAQAAAQTGDRVRMKELEARLPPSFSLWSFVSAFQAPPTVSVEEIPVFATAPSDTKISELLPELTALCTKAKSHADSLLEYWQRTAGRGNLLVDWH